MANDRKGITDQFPFSPCGGFPLQGNWSWQDPVFSAIYWKPCTHLDTLWFPRTMWRLSFAYWHMACIFQSFVYDFVWFPSAAQRLCKGFYAFTSRVLNTLRQHIWSSHFFSNICTWKPHGGLKQCVLSLTAVHISQPLGRKCAAKANPCLSLTWQLVPGPGAPTCHLPSEDICKYVSFPPWKYHTFI